MNKFLAVGLFLAVGASPTLAFEGASLPGVGAFLKAGTINIADTGPGAFQDPFAKAAKKVVYGRLSLADGVTLEWDSRDYATSAANAIAARKKLGQGIHDMSDVLKGAGPDAWVILRDPKSGDSYFVFSRTNAEGETTFPNAKITGASKKEVIDGKLWLTFPNGKDGSYQLARLVPNAEKAVDRTFSFTDGKLDGEITIDNASDLNLLLKQPAFAEAIKAMDAAKLNEETSYSAGIKGFVADASQSLTLSQSKNGTLTVGLNKDGKSVYEITANKEGAELAAVGQ